MPQRISNLINRLARNIHCLQFAEGLNPAQWEGLRFLARANRYSRTPSALAEYLRTTKGTASQTLKSLEAKGYVERIDNPDDRRAVRLDLTESGKAVLGRDPLKCVEAAAKTLGDDIENANRVLSRLAGGIEKSQGSKSFGLCGECTHFCKNVAVAATATAAVASGPHRCGLKDDPLSDSDSGQICVNHRA